MKDSFSQNVALYSGNQKEDLLAAPGWPSAALCWIRHHQSDPPAHTDNWLNQKLRIRYADLHSHNVQAPSFTSESGESPACLQESCHTTNHCQDSSPRQQNSQFPSKRRSSGVSRKYTVCLVDNNNRTNNIIILIIVMFGVSAENIAGDQHRHKYS